MKIYAVLFDGAGIIQQRMSGGALNIGATAAALGLSHLVVEGDSDFERTHRVVDGKLVDIAE